MDRHKGLLESLLEFYTVLVQLAVIPQSLLHVPPGWGPDPCYNLPAAVAAGYTDDAALLMGRLPYIDIDPFKPTEEESDSLAHNGLEILPDTYAMKFVGDLNSFDESWFRDLRAYREPDSTDEEAEHTLPPSFISLTTIDVYGYRFVYDTETELMWQWKPFDDDTYSSPVDLMPGKSPSEVLGPLTTKYRTLGIIRYPHEIEWTPDEPYIPNKDASEKQVAFEAGLNNLRLAGLKLRDLYYDCGWDANSTTQDAFDRDKFLRMRETYVRGVLKPLSDLVWG